VIEVVLFGFELSLLCSQAASCGYQLLSEQFLICRIVGDGQVIGIRIILPLDRAEVVVGQRIIWIIGVAVVFGILLTLQRVTGDFGATDVIWSIIVPRALNRLAPLFPFGPFMRFPAP
jgi:hypothetical protein